MFTPIADWQKKSALPVTGKALATGHFIPDQAPELLNQEIKQFFLV
jgi:hypothetical protein